MKRIIFISLCFLLSVSTTSYAESNKNRVTMMLDPKDIDEIIHLCTETEASNYRFCEGILSYSLNIESLYKVLSDESKNKLKEAEIKKIEVIEMPPNQVEFKKHTMYSCVQECRKRYGTKR